MEGGCGFFRSDRSVALSLKKERKDLVKTACVSIIWEMTGRDEGTKESKAVRPAQKSTKRIALIFQTQISMSGNPATQKNDFISVWFPMDLRILCLEGGIFAGWAQGSIS